MNKAISVLLWAAGTLITAALFFAMLFVVIILYPFDKQRKAAHAQCFWWSDILMGMNPFWKVEIRGLDRIDKKAAYVIVANHESLADIILLYKTRMQFKWVAKEELFKVPFIGWCLSLAKHMALIRGNYSSIKKLYHRAAALLREDMSVLFFPEGTRSDTGQMNEFQNGAFKLAIKEKKPILPILLSGTRDAIEKGSWVFSHNVTCSLNVLDPIPTTDLTISDFERLKSATVERFKNKD